MLKQFLLVFGLVISSNIYADCTKCGQLDGVPSGSMNNLQKLGKNVNAVLGNPINTLSKIVPNMRAISNSMASNLYTATLGKFPKMLDRGTGLPGYSSQSSGNGSSANN